MVKELYGGKKTDWKKRKCVFVWPPLPLFWVLLKFLIGRIARTLYQRMWAWRVSFGAAPWPFKSVLLIYNLCSSRVVGLNSSGVRRWTTHVHTELLIGHWCVGTERMSCESAANSKSPPSTWPSSHWPRRGGGRIKARGKCQTSALRI